MKRAILVVWFLAIAMIGGGAWWYLFSPGSVPEGQWPLGDAAAFRQAFAAGVGKNRLVVVLSPTTASDLGVAQQLQTLLMEYENDTLEAHVVWYAAVKTDWAPATDALARVWDRRARHYWDKEGTVRREIGEGRALLFARGAGLDSPALRTADWQAGLGKMREFLGTPKKQQ